MVVLDFGPAAAACVPVITVADRCYRYTVVLHHSLLGSYFCVGNFSAGSLLFSSSKYQTLLIIYERYRLWR